MSVLLSTFLACSPTTESSQPGPAERAGAQIDQTMQDTAVKAKELEKDAHTTLDRAQRSAVQTFHEASRAVGEAIKDAGQAVNSAAQDTADYLGSESAQHAEPKN